MKVSFFKIGGLVHKVEWNNWLPSLNGPSFRNFQVYSSAPKPDISYRFVEVRQSANELKKKRPNCWIVDYVQSILKGDSQPQSLLLQAEEVEYFFSNQIEINDNICMTVENDYLCAINFVSCEYSLFFHSEWGEYFPEYFGHIPQYYIKANLSKIFSTFLPQFNSLMLHSSGVLLNGRAAIFFAVDGGGKTTALKNFQDSSVLNDDQNIFCKNQEFFRAHNSPFGTILHEPRDAPVGGFFVLSQNERFFIEQGNARELANLLWKENANNFFLLPKNTRIHAFDLLLELCHSTPVYKMHFPKDYIDWNAIIAVMK